MDQIDEHYENVEKSSSELRWFFEERGHEIEIDNKIDVSSKTMRYTIGCGNYIFKCSTSLMEDYSAINKIWECYKKVIDTIVDYQWLNVDENRHYTRVEGVKESVHYEWIDSDRLEGLMKHLHT